MSKWEDLRKRARQLEQEIDKKLVSFNKLHQSITSSRAQTSAWSSTADRQPLIGQTDDVQRTFEQTAAELQTGIAQLQEINDQMHSLTGAQQSMDSSTYSNAAVQHTLRRHEDILRDYTNELTRTRGNIQRAFDRRQLMGGSSDDDIGTHGMSSAYRNDHLVKEHGHIRASDRMLDEQISIAIQTKEHLMNQRANLRDIWKKIDTVTKRYPAVNSLMHKIQIKKRKDAIVVGGVITLCLIIVFLFLNM